MPVTLATIETVNYAVNTALQPCAAAPCSQDWEPRLTGKVDCKQYAAVKLRELIVLGAMPGEFAIQLTTIPGPAGRRTHAVLVHRASGLVLDNLIGLVEPRSLKRQHEGMEFGPECDVCAGPAVSAAEAILAKRGAR